MGKFSNLIKNVNMYNQTKEIARLKELAEAQQKLIELYREGAQERDDIINTLKRLVDLQQIEIDELKKEAYEKRNKRSGNLDPDSVSYHDAAHARQLLSSKDKLKDQVEALKTVSLPESQLRIIRNALKHYQAQVDDQFLKFDCQTLAAFFHYETRVSVPESNAESFSALHGIDFPEYTENGVV